MGLKDSIRKILGIAPVNIGEINRAITSDNSQAAASVAYNYDIEDLEITQEFKNVVKLIQGGCPVIFVTGKAGTGKSTLINYLRLTLNNNLAVVAPTGVAALNAKGVTIHSLFRFPPRILNDEDIKVLRNNALYKKLDLLIIDEISMVRCDILDSVDKFLRVNRDSELPFGGVQLLLIGDLFQLPPVVKSKEQKVLYARGYASPYFFSANSLQEISCYPVELLKVFRQKDASFIKLLNDIRIATNVHDVVSTLNATCLNKAQISSSEITLATTNYIAEVKNSKELNSLPSQEFIFRGSIKGRFSIEEDRLPSPLSLRLKNGAQVMLTKNDDQKRWVNGTLGKIKNLSNDNIKVELLSDYPGRVYDIPKAKWETFKYSYDRNSGKIIAEVIGEYLQYPLMLAWAITIHKSQGKTLDSVYVDFGDGVFAPGQTYVALSRCKSLNKIRLAKPIRESDIKCDSIIKKFYDSLSISNTS